MKWILALPDLAGNKVRMRVALTGVEPADGLTLGAEVRSWPDGRTIGRDETPAALKPDPDPLGGAHSFVEVPMPDFKPSTYEQPNLYTAQVTPRRGPKVLDTAPIRFGMREVSIAGGIVC